MQKFISIKKWLNEQESISSPTYGCIMMDAKIPKWEELHIAGIDQKDLYVEPGEDYGLETEPHVTVLYGIHEDEIDPEVIMSVIEKNMETVVVTITNISIFENDKYDVVKYDVPVTEELQKYRDMFMKAFPNTQTFPDYHPHITLAYVKPGEGSKYVKELNEPFEVVFDKGVYSFHTTNDEGETELVRKQFVFPKEDDFEVDLTSDGSEIISPFKSDNK